MKQALHIAFILFVLTLSNRTIAQNINITGPAGSQAFGYTITVLTSGNYVVADPFYDDGVIVNVGAVYLYDGSNHTLISTLKGSKLNDQVGSNGVFALSTGNFVVSSTMWDDDNGSTNVGAVTFVNGVTGLSGIISETNSLVGFTSNDEVGGYGITTLSNGNYIVRSGIWDNGAISNAGAVTFGDGTTGVAGKVNATNSLVGSSASDLVGSITVLSNGNYVVANTGWDNGAAINAGAVTFGSGTTGVKGVISAANSLVGATTNDNIGTNIIKLTNGNYVVRSQGWDNGAVTDAGAVTFGNGTTGMTGVVSSTNSLVGTTPADIIGSSGVTALTNGNYVVSSSNWDNAGVTDAGAVTFCNGTTGTTGAVTNANSLVGTSSIDNVGNNGIKVLGNGNYVIFSPRWNNGAITDAGAVTFGNGTTGTIGIVSASSSLVGSTAFDGVGAQEIKVLTNNNYLVITDTWDNGAATDAGAVTFCNGTTGTVGAITASNSLVGSKANDQIGSRFYTPVAALSNGNYVVSSPLWDNGTIIDAGAATWGNGTTGVSGIISSSNSLVGSIAYDAVGGNGITVLTNGNYVVVSPEWDNASDNAAGAATWGNGTTGITGLISSSNSLIGKITDRIGNNGVIPLTNGNYVVISTQWTNTEGSEGAVTWGNGATGTTGLVSSSNSLVGENVIDRIGSGGVTALSNGNYVVRSSEWGIGALTDAGAVTWGNGTTGITGIISSSNSLVGNTANNKIGSGGITGLSNGNYVVRSNEWDNGAVVNAGAVTWGNGTTGIAGIVGAANSLVGSAASDGVSAFPITVLSDGNYVVNTTFWNNGAVTDAGAVSLGNGSVAVNGILSNCNSVVGSVGNSGVSGSYAYNPNYKYLIGGRYNENIVTIHNPSGMALANTLDVTTVTINGTNPVALLTNSGCRIIATLTPNGGTPVKGTVNAQAWVETTVPIHAGQPFVARHFEITPLTDPTGSTGRVTLYFTQQEFTDFNNHTASILDLPTGAADAAGKSNVRVGKYKGTSNNGTGLPGSYTAGAEIIDPADGDITWNSTLSRWEVSFNTTGFSGFILQTAVNVLPLTLLEFNGKLLNNNGLLNWKTTNELNSHAFEIERSIDGRNYTRIGTIPSLNTAGLHHYNYTDNNIALLGVKVVYYRLKQKDADGRMSYSNIVALTLNNSNMVMLYPNPVADNINLTITVNRAENVHLRIIDNTGRLVKQQLLNLSQGSISLPIDVKNLARGMYWLELKGETMNERKQFVKQ